MSYSEYIGMFIKCQKNECPYRAFMFDVVNSKTCTEYQNTRPTKFFKLIDCIYCLLEQEQININKKILLKDEYNTKFKLDGQNIDCNKCNPMILGDMITFFVYNNSITTQKMIEIFVKALNICEINYAFHFNTGVYQTNKYIEGGNKLFKGYVPQILENLSKNNSLIIKKDLNLDCGKVIDR